MARAPQLLITCEHAGQRVPARYAGLFRAHHALLRSHRGYDAGALPLARSLAKHFGAPLFIHRCTRLLVDVNRSPNNPAVFSDITRALPRVERLALLERYHTPHRAAVKVAVETALRSNQSPAAPVIHIGVHSFTPILRGRIRPLDIGLLYEPKRQPEKRFCATWRTALRPVWPDARIRMNQPYRGASDGLTTTLRRHFPIAAYLGIELEINQALFTNHHHLPGAITKAIIRSLRNATRA